jgi:glycosyltransferase involved in cell wall biosynthesis
MSMTASTPFAKFGQAPVPILFVHSGRNWIRGSEQILLDLVTHLDRTRFAPVVCCDSRALADRAASLGVPVHQVSGWQVAASQWLPSRAEVEQMRTIVDTHRIRLIHANDTEPIKALLPVARQQRVPVVAHLHIAICEAERRWSFLHQVAHAVGVSEAAAAGLVEDRFPPSRLSVVYNGIDPERLNRGDARGLRGELGIPSTAVVCTVLGSLIPRKGDDVVLEAFELLERTGTHCHLLFCGDGQMREALEARARSLSTSNRIHFLGERGDAGAILRDATDVLVSASREEAFPLNVIEAAFFAVPIVATDIPAHREFLGDGRPGVLVPLEDPSALAAAIHRLTCEAGTRRAYGAEGRKRVLESFLVSHVVDRFDELYTMLLARPPREFGWVKGTTWPHSYTEWVTATVARRLRRIGHVNGARS